MYSFLVFSLPQTLVSSAPGLPRQGVLQTVRRGRMGRSRMIHIHVGNLGVYSGCPPTTTVCVAARNSRVPRTLKAGVSLPLTQLNTAMEHISVLGGKHYHFCSLGASSRAPSAYFCGKNNVLDGIRT